MKLAVIYDKYNEATLGVHYQKAFEKLGIDVRHFWLKDSRAIEPVFDAYIRIDDGDYKYDISHNKLRPSVFYASDVHLAKPFAAIKKAAQRYDLVFCAQEPGCRMLKKIYGDKISWLPHACDPDIHRDLGRGRTLDVAFVGNDGGIPRKFILQELRERFPNSHIGNAPYLDIARIYSSAKIGFNYSIAGDINMRMFEITACGAMLLTNALKDEAGAGLFTDRKDAAFYRSPVEIFELIGHYLKNDAQRQTIAEKGRALTASEHTYLKRAQVIIEHIKRLKNK